MVGAVAVGLAGATIAVAVGWSLRRSRQTAGSRSDDFLDDCERSGSLLHQQEGPEAHQGRGEGDLRVRVRGQVERHSGGREDHERCDSQVASREESRKYIQSFEKEVELLSVPGTRTSYSSLGTPGLSAHLHRPELMAKNLSELTRSKGYVPDDIQILASLRTSQTGLPTSTRGSCTWTSSPRISC